MWNRVVPALEARRTVVRLDFRGFGQSPAPWAAFRNRDDVLAVLDHLSIGSAHLVGASMGGIVSMQVALAAPDRVSSLVLLAPGLPGHDYSQQMRDYFKAEELAVERGDLDAATELDLEMWVRGPERAWSDLTRSVADEMRAPIRTCLATMGQTEQHELDADPPVQDSLHLLVVPTLVGVAEADPADLIDIAEHLGSHIAGARTIRFPDTGHLIAMERPTEAVAVIEEFLAHLRTGQSTV
jgi:pimeloyl-ACP methyl ester carboxylesterase